MSVAILPHSVRSFEFRKIHIQNAIIIQILIHIIQRQFVMKFPQDYSYDYIDRNIPISPLRKNLW